MKLVENCLFYRSIGYSVHWDVLRLRRDDVAIGVGGQVLVDHLHHAHDGLDRSQGLLHRSKVFYFINIGFTHVNSDKFMMFPMGLDFRHVSVSKGLLETKVRVGEKEMIFEYIWQGDTEIIIVWTKMLLNGSSLQWSKSTSASR